MIFGSVCSGIEAASVASKPLGWRAAFFSEIEKFPSQVLEDRNKGVPNLGDMTKFEEWNIDDQIKLLCGGTPCQSFSVAGLRKGLDDSRGNLMLTFGEMAAKLRPQWLFWENVPGVLSSNGGSDFGAFLGLISGRAVPTPKDGWGKAGIIPGYRNAYGLAYRIFDAQYFGVAQRRRRVFVVGYLGDWRPAAAVLFERESMCGNPTPSRETGQKVAPCVTNGPPFSRTGNERVEAEAMVVCDTAGTMVARGPHAVSTHRMVAFGEYSDDGTASAMKARDYKDATDLIAHTLRAEGFDASEDGTGRQNLIAVHGTQDPDVLIDKAHTLGRNSGQENAVFDPNQITSKTNRSQPKPGISHTLPAAPNAPVTYPINTQIATRHEALGRGTGMGIGATDDPAYTLQANHSHAVAFQQNQLGEVRESGVSGTLNTNSNASGRNTPMAKVGMAVRRLTPVECERLQGFPDNYTNVPDAKGKPAADGPRYKALGNSWAVPNVAWIFRRIDHVERMREFI